VILILTPFTIEKVNRKSVSVLM